MSDNPNPAGLAPMLPGSPGVPVGLILSAFQDLVRATNAETQAIKGALGVPASGDVSGTYPVLAVVSVSGTGTNNNAATGKVGEFFENSVASGAALALVTATGLTVTSISLSAGDWDVWAYSGFTGDAATTVDTLTGSLSLTAATLDQTLGRWASQTPMGATLFNTQAIVQFAGGQSRFSLAAPTNVFLVARAAFAVGACKAFGYLAARRRR